MNSKTQALKKLKKAKVPTQDGKITILRMGNEK